MVVARAAFEPKFESPSVNPDSCRRALTAAKRLGQSKGETMAQQLGQDADSAGATKRIDRKAELIQRFGIEGEMIRASQLSAIVGIVPKTLLGLARRSEFPIPHRKVGRSILFALDDVVAWICRDPEFGAEKLPSGAEAGGVHCARILPLTLVTDLVEHAAITAPETPAQRADRISRNVVAKMARNRGRA